MKKNVIIIGAAGRDFHNFNTYFRGNKDYNVVAFTAEQIPGIDQRNLLSAGRYRYHFQSHFCHCERVFHGRRGACISF